MSRILPSLKQTLERVETLDPAAQDARRLMSIHLPGLIERYERVPPAYRQERTARTRPSTSGWSRGSPPAARRLPEVAEQLARADVAALETQGRFIQSRYGEQGIEPEHVRTSERAKHLAIARGGGAAHDKQGLTATGADGGCSLPCPVLASSRKAVFDCRPACRHSTP